MWAPKAGLSEYVRAKAMQTSHDQEAMQAMTTRGAAKIGALWRGIARPTLIDTTKGSETTSGKTNVGSKHHFPKNPETGV